MKTLVEHFLKEIEGEKVTISVTKNDKQKYLVLYNEEQDKEISFSIPLDLIQEDTNDNSRYSFIIE